jgi:hypothetical protein
LVLQNTIFSYLYFELKAYQGSSSYYFRLDPLKEVMEPDGKIDPVKLEDWINKARLDPNDPENEDLLTR